MKENRKEKRKIVVAIVIAFALLAGCAVWYHSSSVRKIKAALADEQAQKALMEERVAEITGQLNGTIEERNTLKDKVSALGQQIEDLLVEEVVLFDAAMITEEVKEIGELATEEYCYTNVGTVDGTNDIKVIGWTIPFSKKTAVVTMDGVLKAGIDISKVEISCNEETRTILVKMPAAKILSNELDEDSMTVYDEDNGLFNPITLSDGSSIRTQIKTEAETRAIKNGLLTKAKTRAQEMIRHIIFAVPGIEENYRITFL